jgi:hypothetical protein
MLKRGDMDALMRYEADKKLYQEKLTQYLIEQNRKSEALHKWFNWNDWCAGWWKGERDFFGSNKPLIDLAADIADTLVAPGAEQIRLDEHDLPLRRWPAAIGRALSL